MRSAFTMAATVIGTASVAADRRRPDHANGSTHNGACRHSSTERDKGRGPGAGLADEDTRELVLCDARLPGERRAKKQQVDDRILVTLLHTRANRRVAARHGGWGVASIHPSVPTITTCGSVGSSPRGTAIAVTSSFEMG